MSAPPRVVILGAGPAGLTAAYALVKKGATPVVLEADPEYVGGISRTIRYKGFILRRRGAPVLLEVEDRRGPLDGDPIYIYRIKAGTFSSTKKMILLK